MKLAVATVFVFALGIAPGIKAYDGPPPPDPTPPKPATAHKAHPLVAGAPARSPHRR